MDRFWLKHYPPGVPADVDLTQYRSLVHLIDDGLVRFACARCVCVHGQEAELRRGRSPVGGFCGLAAGPGSRTRRARGAHDAERPAVSDRARRRAARGLRGGQRQPALHAARARAPAPGFRSRGDRDTRELRDHAAAGDREDRGEARRGRLDRRPARIPEGRDHQLRHPADKEDGAGLHAARSGALQRRRRRRRAAHACQAGCRSRRHRVPAVHRRNHRRVEGSDPAAPEHGRQRPAARGLGQAGARRLEPRRRARSSSSTSARCRSITCSRWW